MDKPSTYIEELKERLSWYLDESGINGMKREELLRRLRGDSNPILPHDETDAVSWRHIRNILVHDVDFSVDGSKRGTTYFLRQHHDSRASEDPEITAQSIIDALRGVYPEHHRFEKRSIPHVHRGKGNETTYSTEDMERGFNRLLSDGKLFREGTGRGTRYYWVQSLPSKRLESARIHPPADDRKRVSVTLPWEIYGWLKSVVGDEMEYRSQSEVIEKALWDCRSDEIAQWKREQED